MPAEKKLFMVCRKSGKIVGFNRRGWRFKVLFPLLAVLALVWYLVRVLPKPSRAAYPCQRVGAPIAFAGLAYLLSIFGLATAWHHGRKFIRQNRYAVAGACLLIGLVCGAMVRNLCENRALATENTGTFIPADAPNSPIGTARGIYPGRVAWSYNTNACNWDGSSSYWWSSKFNNQAEITVMMNNVICSVAGQATVSNAWDALFRANNGGPTAPSYGKGQSIAIKINENNGGNNSMIDASPQSVYALLDGLVNQFGAGQSDITLCDPARSGESSAVQAYCQGALPNVNYNNNTGNFTANAFAYSQNFTATTGVAENSLATTIVNAKYLITMALLKRHAMPYPTYGDSFNDGNAPVTMIFKSDWGIIGNNRSSQHVLLHTWEKPVASYDLLVDIYGSKHINGKTVLTLLDGLYSGFLWNSGPTNWVMAPFNGHYPSSFFASQDPVALESVGIDFMWADMGLVANADRTVREAALANNPPSGTVYQPDGVRLKSLGVHENWNNSTNKMFSRNLGTGLGIELVTVKPGVPSVSILGMASGFSYPPGTNLSLQALVINTNYPVSQVAYYQGAQLLGTATASPYTVTLTNVALGNYALTAVATDASGLVVTSNPVNIVVTTGPVNFTWNASPASPGLTDGGGSWDLTTTDWWNGSTNVAWNNATPPALTSFGVTNGPAGTVTLGAAITVGNLSFNSAGSGNYTIAAGPGGGPLTFANNPAVTVAANCSPVISAPVAGAGFTYAGPGTLTLSGPNTLGGSVALTGGTLALIGNNTGSTASGSAAPGTTLQVANGFNGALVLNSGSTLQLRGDGNTTFAPSGITLDNAADTYTFDAGPLTSATGNTLTLNGALTFLASANQLIKVTGNRTDTLALGNLIGTTTGHNPYVAIALNTLANGPALTVGAFQSGNWSQWLNLQGGGRVTLTGNITNVSNGSSIIYVTDGTTATLLGRSSFSPSATATADAYKYCVANGTLVLDNGCALTNNTSGTGLGASCFLLGAATNVFAVSGAFSAPAGVLVNTNNSWNAAVYLGDAGHPNGGITLNAKTTNNVSDGDLGFANRGVFTLGGQNTSGINTFANTIILGLTANRGKSVTLAATAGGEVDFTGPILANGSDPTAGVTVGDAAHGGTVKLTGANTYAGGTTVANGILLVNNTSGSGTGPGPVTVANGGTLAGSGTINGAVTIQTGGTLALKPSIGTLTINHPLTLAGNLCFQANKSLNFNNSLAAVSGNLTNSGTGVLTITNAGPALAAGDTFKLFNQPLAGGGALTLVPATPGCGLAWVNNLAVNGTLAVAAVATNAVSLGLNWDTTNLGLVWPPDHTGWQLQAQTNPAGTGLSTNWVTLPGSTATNQILLPVNPANGTVFFRLIYTNSGL